jgi:prenyltransferase beta subunit
MLQVARLAPKLLGDSTPLVENFLRSQLGNDGGFAGRDGRSDLYYTVFGLDGLLALRAELPAGLTAQYLQSFGDGAGLDFVHLACLARCWSAMPTPWRDKAPRNALLRRIEEFRAGDGGYDDERGSASGTIYGCFLAYGAYQDLAAALPSPDRIVQCIQAHRTADGGYSNLRDAAVGLTPVTAGAATLLRHLGIRLNPAIADWLLVRCGPQGGFFATPEAPLPDLLSTATAIHALVGLHADLGPIEESCLDFVDSLWTSRGGFFGHWADDAIDCEYTYYGLLSLGHLSL